MPDLIVTEPGVYDIPEELYRADPVPGGSLSQSGAKKLLRDGGPAIYHYEQEHGSASTKAQDLGTAAHKLALGTGQELHEVKAKDWTTKAAKQDRDEAREAGKLPLLTHELETVTAMAGALRAHPTASALLDPERGRPEMSAFWQDAQFGIWRRLRWDFMPEPDPRRRSVIADYKTAADASPKAFAKSVVNFGYHLQADWYSAGYAALFGAVISAPPAFVFIAQEKTPPYLVATYQLPAEALRLGRDASEKAMEIYRDCREAQVWPGYSAEIEVLELPYWAYREDSY